MAVCEAGFEPKIIAPSDSQESGMDEDRIRMWWIAAGEDEILTRGQI